MRISATTSHILSAAVILCASALSLQAAGPAALKPTPASGQKAAAEASEVTALRPAFTTLLTADHDYQGHRAKAMHAIAAACRLMGTDIMPPGTGAKPHAVGAATGVKHATTEPEQQTVSDAQLRQAQTIVQQVRGGIASGTQPKVSAHLDEAITEIGLALAVK